MRLTIEPSTPKVESCKFRPRFEIAVVVGLQPVPCSGSAGDAHQETDTSSSVFCRYKSIFTFKDGCRKVFKNFLALVRKS